MRKAPWLILLSACMLFLWRPQRAAADEVNPCRSATATAVALDDYLDITYRVSLSNPTATPADVMLLMHTKVLESVEGVRGDLVVNRQGSALMASVPPGWQGELTIRTKSPIADAGGPGWRKAVISLPPAVSRYMDLDLPGRNVELTFPLSRVGHYPIVTTLPASGDRCRFRVIPVHDELFVPMWASLPPARPTGYSLHETHRITEDVPAFTDDVTLEFIFAGALPDSVSVKVPAGVAISSIEVSDGARWKIADGRLVVSLPDRLRGSALTVQCHLEGAAQPDGQGAHLFAVPLFAGPQAQRHQGAVYIDGGRHELAFAVLEGARQTAAEGWRLACEFQGDARIAVRAAPMAVRTEATVETHYIVSEYRVIGMHRISYQAEGEQPASLVLTLPVGHTVRAVSGDVRDWSQEGGVLRVALSGHAGAASHVQVTTESLTGGRLKLELAPPVVADATSVRYAMAITHSADVQLKTARAQAPWRVTPQALPAWLRSLSPPIAYSYRDAAPPVALEVLPVEAELRGSVQDHVTVSADRVRRDTLFLLDIQKRAVSELDFLLPAGLTAESVEGPYVESWDVGVGEDGSTRVSVRLPRPILGAMHLRLVSSRRASPGRVALRGIRLEGAPALRGHAGISTDVGVRVRPLEDGRMNLASVRTDQAPAYLAGFDNRLVYEFYSSDWELELTVEQVTPLYEAAVLNALSFRASGVEASALVRVTVLEGGLGELEVRLPQQAVAPEVEDPQVVSVRWSDGAGLMRFRGPRTGTFTVRVDYVVPAGTARSELDVEPVQVVGARSQSGVLLLLQASPDVDVRAGAPPHSLQPTEAQQRYEEWSYVRAHPAMGAYVYRETGWRLPVTVAAHGLSGRMLQAIIPLARLDTLVQESEETLNHLRLYVTNTTQQFLTVDLANLHPEARLIGTYVYGEPVKPFRRGKTKLELPLFANETATRVGMSVIDITYSAPTSELRPLSRRRFRLPDLGLNVGKVEWTVRLPRDYRLTAVGGNLAKPVSAPPPVPSLAARLLRPVAPFVRAHRGSIIALAVIGALIVAFFVLPLLVARVTRRPLGPMFIRMAVLLLILAIVASLFMPAGERARRMAKQASESSNMHNIGLALSVYRADHEGAFPADIRALQEEGYIGDPDVFESPSGRDVQLVYRRPAPDAPPDEVVAYFWHPATRGATVLYVDNEVRWTVADAEGNLRNPRNGALLARADELARPTEQRAKAAFAGARVETEELAEALQIGQQMARPGARPSAGKPVDMAQVNEALIAANMDKIKEAMKRYAREHGGREPDSPEELSAYITDSRLRQAVRQTSAPPAALERARRVARQSTESSVLHNIGLAMSMYRNDHEGRWPPSPEVLAKDYLGDPHALISPRADIATELVYLRPSGEAAPDDVVAYFWSPKFDGANLLYADGRVRYTALDAQGRLLCPRTGRLIARPPTLKDLSDEERTKLAQMPAGPRFRVVTAPPDAGIAGQQAELGPAQLAQQRYSLGKEYMKRGDYAEAEKQFARALQLAHDYQDAKRELDVLRNLRRALQAGRQQAPAPPEPAAEASDKLQTIEAQMRAQEQAMVGSYRGALVRRQARAGAAAPVPTPPQEPLLKTRYTKASLVRQVAGGRSIGALPILIDFPTPETVSYEFVKPFLGRAGAALSFRVVPAGALVLLELLLAALALVGYGLMRRRSAASAASVAAAALLVTVALLVGAPPAVASLFGATALAMAVCLAAELMHTTFSRMLGVRTDT